ncbi:MAG: 16S rRNA (cytidine(1402)-2'-O)-methyltransferase [Bacilli bacterium]
MSQKSYDDTPTLYLIPTPIGNYDDITLRTLKTLEQIDVLFCEDTRVTGQLLHHFNIRCQLIANHLHNEKHNKEKILTYLKSGQSIGLVSDRGTPIISDPGIELAKHVIANNYNVVSLPGATALIPALTIAGLDANYFLFYGFLDAKDGRRRKQLSNLMNYPMTIIFYEAPHRIVKTMNDILDVFGDRNICVAREISKKFEEVYRGKVSDVIKQVQNIKGEIVIVVAGNKNLINYEELPIDEHIKIYMQDGLNSKEAIKEVAKQRKVNKNVVYKEYHHK